jgi:serine-type D-Ala-D-Ala carboxypeptidase (penicillin-binding protein 5/6)
VAHWRALVASVLVVFVFAAPVSAARAAAAGSGAVPGAPDVAAGAWVVADAGSGAVLGWRDPHGWYRPASTLKMLTAVAVIPVLNPSASVRASSRAADVVPNVAGLVPGHYYRVSDLLAAMLTISANDAAVALVQATGSYAHGIALMNQAARRLGARDTVAVDPNGLDAPGQHTSAYDLALIARQALRTPAFMHYDETRMFSFPVTAHRSEMLYNQNRLLSSYPGGIGGKIGWTSAAGATYVGMARRHGVTLIVTLLHCPALTETVSAERLLNWGFAVDGRIKPVGHLVSPDAASPTRAGASRPAGAGRAGAATRLAHRPVRAALTNDSTHPVSAAGVAPRGNSGTRTVAACVFTAMTLLAVVCLIARMRRRGSPSSLGHRCPKAAATRSPRGWRR